MTMPVIIAPEKVSPRTVSGQRVTVGAAFVARPVPRQPTVRDRAEKAVANKHRAAKLRRLADEEGASYPTSARFMRKDADILDAKADEGLALTTYTTGLPRRGNGGELVPLPEMGTGMLAAIVSEPADALAHSASTQRMELSAATDSLSLGLDLANGIKAKNAVEKMLAQQAGAVHKMAMEFMAQASGHMQKAQTPGAGANTVMAQNIEACRLAAAATRLMGAFNEAVLTVRRHRSGGQQVVNVRHYHQQVKVEDGGQAVIAGSMRGRKVPRLASGGK
jgi:hypothetical protein